MTTIKVSSYASELLFVAGYGTPWECSEEQFAGIVALLQDGHLEDGDRQDVTDFFVLACSMAATVDERAADVASIYKAARECAKRRGAHVYGQKPGPMI